MRSRRSKNSFPQKIESRDTADITNRRLRLDNPYKLDLRLFEDRRTFHPDTPGLQKNSRYQDYVRSYDRVSRQIRVGTLRHMPNVNKYKPSGSIRNSFPTYHVRFQEPQKVTLCARRKIRKEVMHALKKTGKSGQKPAKWKWYSHISCRR